MLRARIGLGMAATAFALLWAVMAPAAGAAGIGTFQKRASSPQAVNNVVVDPPTNMIYAQQYEGKGFYRYNPRTNKWTTLAKAPIKQGQGSKGFTRYVTPRH